MISHLITVGACVDTERFEGLAENDIKAFAYVGNTDEKRVQAHRQMQNNAKTEGYGSLIIKTLPGDYDKTISIALTSIDDPSVTDCLSSKAIKPSFSI